jgi:hypothetical protein
MEISHEVVEVSHHEEEATFPKRDEIWNFSTNIIIIFPKSHPSYFKKNCDGPSIWLFQNKKNKNGSPPMN